MNNIYQHYIIDLSSNNNFVQIPVMQGDGEHIRGFEVELIQNGTQYIIDREDTLVSIVGTKPDTKQIMNPCEITDDGYILVGITSQMSAVTGRGDYQIVLMSRRTNSQLKSFPFHILTTSAAFDAGDIVSSDEFQALTKNITRTEAVIDNANLAISDMRQLASQVSEDEAERAAAENIRIIAENARDSAEAIRISEENNRTENESIRENAEAARTDSEYERSVAETARAASENSRIVMEDERKAAEDARKDAESVRANAEAERLDTESARAENETIRIANEIDRNLAEQARDLEEAKRTDAEKNRIANEDVRQTDESARQSNEAARQSNTAAVIADAEKAAQRANTAAQTCENIAAGIDLAPLSHASSEKIYGISSVTEYGHAMASSTVPKAAGTAAAGSETDTFARGDHVHPLQTTYGICSTDAATAAKTVECKGFGLITGAAVTVKFTVTNSAANPTLNVNSTGAKPIYYRGKAISAGNLAANHTYTFIYTGTQYDLVGDIDTRLSLTNHLTSTSTTAALTAAQGKILNDKITAIDSCLNGFRFYPDMLTQAEYDTLPEETKLTEGMLFVIRKE